MADQEKFKGAFVKAEQIEDRMARAEVREFHRVFDKLTIVVAKMPNGYVLVGSSGCVDPENYDPEIGKEVCLKQIRDRLWELEGYALQEKIRDKV